MSAPNKSGIFRTAKDHNYSIVSNVALRDKRLSFGARGLWGYLMTKQDDWQIREADLVKQTKLGRDGVRTLLKELEAAGYLVRRRFHDDKTGQILWEHIVYEEPQPVEGQVEPLPDIPSMAPWTGLPSTAEPTTAKPSIYKGLSNEELNERNKRIKAEAEYEKPNERKSNAAASDEFELDRVLTETICEVCKQPEENLRGRQIEGLRLSLEFVKALNEYPDLESKAMEIHRRFGGKAWTLPGPPQPSQIQTEWDRQGVKADRIREMETPHATPRKQNDYLTPRQRAAESRDQLTQRLLRQPSARPV